MFMQIFSPLVLLASMTPIAWACGMVPMSAVLGLIFRNRLPTAVACYLSQLCIRKLPVYFSVPAVIATFFAWLILSLLLLEIRYKSDGDESEDGTYGSFEKLRNSPPRGCTDAAVAAVLSASTYYEVRVASAHGVLYRYLDT